jgi:integrase
MFEGNSIISIRHLLADLIAFRKGQGATETDHLFARKNNTWPTFRDVLNHVLREANALIDPTTGEKRVPYSLRHYFATLLIERNLSVAKIAEWHGTSSAMVERHYGKYLVEREAHLLNGGNREEDSLFDLALPCG